MKRSSRRKFRRAGAAAVMGILSFAASCAPHRAAAPTEAIPAVAPVRVLPIISPTAPDPVQPGAAPRAPSDAPAATSAPPAKPPDAAPANAAATPNPLAEQGKERFQAYKCYDCHGANGEGTNDGPDLTGTRRNAEQIAAFLEHPSPDARSAGMPTIPATSADLQPLVAFVLSLKRAATPP